MTGRTYRLTKLSAGELPHPWIITDDTNVLDKRPGRWTNGGQGWRTRREAQAALDELGLPQAGKGRPPEGVKVQVRIPAVVLTVLDLEADMHGISRAELIRGIVGEWATNGGYVS